MDRAWSTRTHEHVQQACNDGAKMIDRLAKLSGQVYSVAHATGAYAGQVPLTEMGVQEGVPNKLYFVPHAKALLFYKSFKAGILLGVEQGSGFVIARLGEAGSNRWSAPAFVRVTGVEFGLVAGADRAETLVGVMSERALDALISSKGKFNMSTNWNFEITPLEEDKSGGANPQWIFNADFTAASVSRGIMADVGLQGTRISWDATWNSHCYGEGTTADKILRGLVEPPPELTAMTDKLRACCSPQLAGIRSQAPAVGEPAAPLAAGTMAGPSTPGAVPLPATTTTTTTAAGPAMAAPAAAPAVRAL